MSFFAVFYFTLLHFNSTQLGLLYFTSLQLLIIKAIFEEPVYFKCIFEFRSLVWSTQVRNGFQRSYLPLPAVVIMHLLSSAKGRGVANAPRTCQHPIYISPSYHTPPLYGAVLDWLVHARALGTRGTERCGVTTNDLRIARLLSHFGGGVRAFRLRRIPPILDDSIVIPSTPSKPPDSVSTSRYPD